MMFGVSIFLQRNSDNSFSVTPKPTYKIKVEADNFKYAAAAAIKKAGFNEYSIDDLFCIRDRGPKWQKNVHLAVRSFNPNGNDEVDYFYIWMDIDKIKNF